MKKRSKGKRVNRQSAKTPKVAMPPLPLSLQPPLFGGGGGGAAVYGVGLTARQRADLRTGVRKSVVISHEKIREALAKRGQHLSAFGARMVGEVVFPMARKMGAATTIKQRDATIAELKRQVRVLKAELKVQAQMWKDARDHRGVGYNVLHVNDPLCRVRRSTTETAEKHARLALLRAKPGNKGNRDLCKQVGLKHFPRKGS